MTGHVEGGYFTEIYKSDETIADLPQRYQNESRSFGTAIYFLLKVSVWLCNTYIFIVFKSVNKFFGIKPKLHKKHNLGSIQL